jgi:hypothetical protein
MVRPLCDYSPPQDLRKQPHRVKAATLEPMGLPTRLTERSKARKNVYGKESNL